MTDTPKLEKRTFVANYDADKNGTVDDKEQGAAATAFDVMDENRDGTLTADEFVRFAEDPQRVAAFNKAALPIAGVKLAEPADHLLRSGASLLNRATDAATLSRAAAATSTPVDGSVLDPLAQAGVLKLAGEEVMRFVLAVAAPESGAAYNSRWNLALTSMTGGNWPEAVTRLEDVIAHAPDDKAAVEALTVARFLAPMQRLQGLMQRPPRPTAPGSDASPAELRDYADKVTRQDKSLVALPSGEMPREQIKPAIDVLLEAAAALRPVRALIARNEPQGAIDLQKLDQGLVGVETNLRETGAVLLGAGVSLRLLKKDEAARLKESVSGLDN